MSKYTCNQNNIRMLVTALRNWKKESWGQNYFFHLNPKTRKREYCGEGRIMYSQKKLKLGWGMQSSFLFQKAGAIPKKENLIRFNDAEGRKFSEVLKAFRITRDYLISQLTPAEKKQLRAAKVIR